MVKVVRIPLNSITKHSDGSEVEYKEICSILWQLQRETREIKNKTIQYAWEWHNFSSDYKKQNGEYPNKENRLNILGYVTLSGYVYDKLKADSSMNTKNLTCTIRAAEQQFNAYIKEYLRGTRSIQEYKSNQPLEIDKKTICLEYENMRFIIKLSMINKQFAKENNLNTQLEFMAQVKSNSIRTILERCFDGVYGISASKLIYNQKKKQWFLNLSYSFENETIKTLDADKILGVDLGVAKPIVASVNGEWDRFMIDGGEIEHIRSSIDARRISMLKQSKYCGDGRVGHGRKTRTKPVDKLSEKISNCRNTINHKYSKALIDYAVKNNCGIIQMENLEGVTRMSDKFLKNWSYYDLQTKIEYKAKEKGIKVVYIEPKYTSQRCSKCGYIDAENRPEQARFKCEKCGFEENADYNASQNIAIRDIDKIISASMKQT